MSVTGDFQALAELAGFLDGLERTATRDAAPAAAAEVAAVASGHYAAGAGPEGPWPANKDGSVPLRGETSKITFAAEGSAVVARAPDLLRFHQEPAEGRPARPVFPAGGELGAWEAPVGQAVQRAVERAAPKG